MVAILDLKGWKYKIFMVTSLRASVYYIQKYIALKRWKYIFSSEFEFHVKFVEDISKNCVRDGHMSLLARFGPILERMDGF